MPEFDPNRPYTELDNPVVTRGSTFGWQDGPGSDSGDNGRFAGGGSSLNDPEDYAALPEGSKVPYGYHFQVRNPDNGAIVWVTRRDIGPAKWTGRGVDLAPSAMRKLGAQTDDPLVVHTDRAVPPFDPSKPYKDLPDTESEAKAPEPAPTGKIIGVTESPPAESTTQKIMDFMRKPSWKWAQPIEKAITSPIPGAAAAIHAGYQYGSPLGWVEDIAPNSDAGKLAHDIRQQLEQTATGFATPANLALGATTAGVPSAIGRLVGAGFTVAQAKDALDTYDQYQSATDPDQKRQLGIRLGVSGAMTALLGGATLMPHPVGKPKVEGTEGAEAAAPAENPASAQSTILEDVTQPEPPLDVNYAKFRGVRSPLEQEQDAQGRLDATQPAPPPMEPPDLEGANFEIAQNGEAPLTGAETAAPPAAPPKVREALSLEELRLMRERNDLQLQADLSKRVAGQTHPAIEARMEEIDSELEDIANKVTGQKPPRAIPEVGEPEPTEANLELGQTGAPAPKSVLRTSRKATVIQPDESATGPTTIPAAPGMLPATALTRPFRAGMYTGQMTFDSALQRDLYDLGAKQRSNITAKNPGPSVTPLLDHFAARLGISRSEVQRLASQVHNDVREQMKGLKDEESRTLTDNSGLPRTQQSDVLQPQSAQNGSPSEQPDASRPRQAAPAAQTSDEPIFQAANGDAQARPEPTQTSESAQAPIGAAARVAAARDEAGLLGDEGAPESGRGIGYQESVAKGNALLDKGADPYKVASDFQKNKLINGDRMGIMRAHLERLQLANSRARGALEAAPHDLKLKRVAQDAQDAENAFWRAYKPMQTEWSNIGTGMQEHRGITDADVHSQTTAEQAMRESLGRELTPKDQQRAARAVKSVKEANGAVEKAWGKAVESASKRAKGKPRDAATLARDLANKLKEITC